MQSGGCDTAWAASRCISPREFEKDRVDVRAPASSSRADTQLPQRHGSFHTPPFVLSCPCSVHDCSSKQYLQKTPVRMHALLATLAAQLMNYHMFMCHFASFRASGHIALAAGSRFSRFLLRVTQEVRRYVNARARSLAGLRGTCD